MNLVSNLTPTVEKKGTIGFFLGEGLQEKFLWQSNIVLLQMQQTACVKWVYTKEQATIWKVVY